MLLVALVDQDISDCEFGFKKERSTLQAVACLTEQIEESLKHCRGKYYTVFVDFRKGFDLINRQKLVKLKEDEK